MMRRSSGMSADPVAWILFSPDPLPRLEAPRWMQLARTFLNAEVAFETDAPTDGADAIWTVQVASLENLSQRTRVSLATGPLSPKAEALVAARAAVRAMGGAGFDVLLDRARRAWRVSVGIHSGSDIRAPLVLAALVAIALQAPILPPERDAIFGVRGARERLEAVGWPR